MKIATIIEASTCTVRVKEFVRSQKLLQASEVVAAAVLAGSASIKINKFQ